MAKTESLPSSPPACPRKLLSPRQWAQWAKSAVRTLSVLIVVFFSPVVYLPGLCLAGFQSVGPIHAHSSVADRNPGLSEEEKRWIVTHPSVRLAPDPEFKPIEFFDENGNYVGMGADFAALIASRVGLKLEILRYENWARVVEAATAREVDLLNAVVKTPNRESFLIFTKPYLTIPSVIIMRKGAPDGISLNDLEGMRVTMVSGYGYADLIRQRHTTIILDFGKELRACLRKVSFGLADAFVGDLATASHYIEEDGIVNLKVAGETTPPNISGFAVRSDQPILARILEKGIATITPEEKRAIMAKWIRLDSEPSISMTRFWKTFGIAAAGAFCCFAMFFAWNRVLAARVRQRTAQLAAESAEKAMAREEAEKARTMLRIMIDSLPLWLACTDAEGNYIIVNSYYQKTFGIPVESIQGRNFKEIFPPDNYAVHRALSEKCILLKAPIEYEDSLVFNGSSVFIQGIYTPILDQNGKVWGIAAVAMDITAKVLMQEEKIRLEARFMESQKVESLGRLAGGVAHDFNNMLGIILGNAQLLKESIPPGTAPAAEVVEIEEAALLSREVTSQLLAFSRKQVVNPVPTDINSMIEAGSRTLSRLIGESITLEVSMVPDLWPVLIDRGQFDQILLNLAGNARDAMPEGGRVRISTARVTIEPHDTEMTVHCPPGKYSELRFSDNGTGIEPSVLPNIFDPFFTTKDESQGSGLGLSMVYGIVRQSGGCVVVESTPGKGAEFRLLFPALVTDQSGGLQAGQSDAVSGAGPMDQTSGLTGDPAADKPARLLVVEDEKMLLKIVKRILELDGHQVIVAESAKIAIDEFERFGGDFDLIISDVIMPGMSGREFKSIIDQNRGDIKFLFMSGYTSNIIDHHLVKAGRDFFIQKPFTMDEFLKTVKAILQGLRPDPQLPSE